MRRQRSAILRTMNVPAILDVEASGFGRGSYPVEVGYVLEDGVSQCMLVRPEPGCALAGRSTTTAPTTGHRARPGSQCGGALGQVCLHEPEPRQHHLASTPATVPST
jgi:hypothetical protein